MDELKKYQQVVDVLSNMKDIQWITTELRESENYEQWIPIFTCSEGNLFLGISKAGYWVLEKDECVVPLLDNYRLRDLLPCLKKPLSEMLSGIEKELDKKDLPIQLQETFPVEGLILSGLKSQSDFWTALALDWLENLPTNNYASAELQRLIEAKWLSQRTRQRIKKLLKRATDSSS